VIGNALGVMEIATGQRDEEYDHPGMDKAAAKLGARGMDFREGPTSSARSSTTPTFQGPSEGSVQAVRQARLSSF
jgi:hypothetical protein